MVFRDNFVPCIACYFYIFTLNCETSVFILGSGFLSLNLLKPEKKLRLLNQQLFCSQGEEDCDGVCTRTRKLDKTASVASVRLLCWIT